MLTMPPQQQRNTIMLPLRRTALLRSSALQSLQWARHVTHSNPDRQPTQPDGKDTRSRPSTHWLDTRAPGARQWLENQSLLWWHKSLDDRCKCVRRVHSESDTLPTSERSQTSTATQTWSSSRCRRRMRSLQTGTARSPSTPEQKRICRQDTA